MGFRVMGNVHLENDIDHKLIVIRADRWAYFSWLVIIGGGPFFISILNVIFNEDTDSLKMFIFCAALELLIFLFLRRQLIVLSATEFSVGKFLLTRKFPVSNLLAADFYFAGRRYLDRFGSISRLRVRTIDDEIIINAKFFKLADLRHLADRINSLHGPH